MSRQEDSVWAWTTSHTRQHGRVGPKGVCTLKVTTTKPGLQVVPANLFQVSCLPPVSHSFPLDVLGSWKETGDTFTGRIKKGQKGKRDSASCLIPHSLQPHISRSCHTAQIRVVAHSHHTSGRGDTGATTVHIPEQRPRLFHSLWDIFKKVNVLFSVLDYLLKNSRFSCSFSKSFQGQCFLLY